MLNEYLTMKYPENSTLIGKIIDEKPFGYIVEISGESGIEIREDKITPLALMHKGQYFYIFAIGDTIKGIVWGYQNCMVHLYDVELHAHEGQI